MQRSDALIKAVSLVVFLALAIYIGVSAYTAKNDPLKTVLTDRFEMTDSVETEGYAVRNEKILESSAQNVSVTASEGERVSAGAAVAVSYVGTDAMKMAEEIRELRLKIGQLSGEKTGKSSEETARETVFDISRAVAAGDMTEMDALALSAEAYIIGSDEAAAESADELQGRLDYLISASASDMQEISVPESGMFAQTLDGFEGVEPESLWEATPSSLSATFSTDTAVGSNAFGKLVTGVTWYYATVMDAEEAARLEEGTAEKLRFHKTYSGTLRMTVESVGEEENGKCVVVFSSDKFLKDIVSLRELYAELVFSEKTGLRVPKEAVHLDEEGDTFVYILQGLQARQVYITILDENGDSYMAEEENGGLRKGAQIITAGRDLYNGKVVA